MERKPTLFLLDVFLPQLPECSYSNQYLESFTPPAPNFDFSPYNLVNAIGLPFKIASATATKAGVAPTIGGNADFTWQGNYITEPTRPLQVLWHLRQQLKHQLSIL